jgi:hypothetical protein
MAVMATPLLIFGTLLQADAAIQEGAATDKLAKFKARQLEQKAGQERAVSQRKAGSVRRQARFAESRALALAAASGGGASDPTIVNIMAGIAGEGEIGAQSALYEGEERARGAELGAKASLYEGAQAKKAGYLKAGATVLSGIGSGLSMGPKSLTSKYAPNYSSGSVTSKPSIFNY